MFLAHRGNMLGVASQENKLEYLLNAVNLGFGVETDLIRSVDGKLIISHDPAPWNPGNDAKFVLNELVKVDAFIALNIKQSGLLSDLVTIIKNFNGFVFDFELCCENHEKEMNDYKQSGFKIAERISDRGERPTHKHDYYWLDEMDSTYSVSIFMNNLNPDKIIYVSPELHGRPVVERRKESFPFICTDYCLDTLC